MNYKNIRSSVFWLIDFLKGGAISKNLNEIENIINCVNQKKITFQDQKIQEILSYAKKNVPFYKKTNFNTLEDFPVVNKMDYKNNIDDFCSSKFKREELIRVVTSGSTGTPFVSYQNKQKKQRNTADALYFGKLAGYELGETLFYVKIWSTNNNKSLLLRKLQNIVPIDVIKLSNQNIKKFISKLNSRVSKSHINGYASSLEEICKYLDNSKSISLKESIKIKSIIAQSEALTNETKSRLNLHFNCLPCSRYSNVENGIIAQQTKEVNHLFNINSASYKVEILKLDEDTPAKHNDLGRIVITDLFNYAMPFIRYDTGDIGKFLVTKGGKIDINYLEEIQGRKLDLLLNTKGEIISSYIMYKNMFQYPEINQYQLIQEGQKQYRFVICINEVFEKEVKLKKEFLSFLGNSAIFNIEYVNEIPLLSSGKKRIIVNNYLKNKKNI